MWVGYFDESGIDDNSKTFCIGGFIATNADWLDLTHAWTQALSGAGIAAFHMTDFEASRGEFQEWKKEQRIKLIDELISVVLSYDVFGIGVGTVREDYTQLIAQTDFISKRKFKPEWWEHPYLFVFQHCIVEAANAVDGLPSTERIAFVFDRQAQFHARAEAVYAQLQEQTEWPRAARLGSHEFQSKDQAVPLQVADLMVYEIRKGLNHKLFEPERMIRKSMNRLKSRLINPRYFDEAALKAYIACFDKDSTA